MTIGAFGPARAPVAPSRPRQAEPRGGNLLGWVDRPEGVPGGTPLPAWNLPSPAPVLDRVQDGFGRLWDWVKGLRGRPGSDAPLPGPVAPPTGPAPWAPPVAPPVAPLPPVAPWAPPPAPVPGPAWPAPAAPGFAAPPPVAAPWAPPVAPPVAPPPPGAPWAPPIATPMDPAALAQLIALREEVHKIREGIEALLRAGMPPAPVAPPPPARPTRPGKPARPKKPRRPRGGPPASPDQASAIERLKGISPKELAHLGRTNKQKFFEVLRPAAEESERIYGVPAAVTLAQAALETGWGQHLAAGYNLFGIKGRGPAGSNVTRTREVYNGKTVYINARFAAYHNFYEAVKLHGKLFHNGYYKKAIANWPKYKDPERFARDIHGIYATDPKYADMLISLMRQYKLK